MKVSVMTIYDRITNPGFFSHLSHGVSFYIQEGKNHILYDLGLIGKILIKNMKILNVNPNSVSKIVLSHGHSDHVGGMNAFLKERTKETVIPVYAHTNVLEPKRAHLGKLRLWNAGFYPIETDLKKKIRFVLSTEPIEITSRLVTTGEIAIEERTNLQNISRHFVHYVNGNWIQDNLVDDTSLILKTKEGLVLICGCCHSGLVNTINKAESICDDKVITLIGGVHLVGAKIEKILKIAKIIENDYSRINFYFNHSIGKRAYRILRKKLGEKQINYAPFGKEFTFDC